MRKGVDEEMAGTTGREENVQRRNILSVAPVEIGCNLLQKNSASPARPYFGSVFNRSNVPLSMEEVCERSIDGLPA